MCCGANGEFSDSHHSAKFGGATPGCAPKRLFLLHELEKPSFLLPKEEESVSATGFVPVYAELKVDHPGHVSVFPRAFGASFS